MKTILISILSILFVTKSHALFFIVEPGKRECVAQRKEADKHFGLLYYVSGEEEDKNRMIILNPDKEEVWVDTNLKKGSYNTITKKEGNHYLCIENTSSSSLTITFEFNERKNEKELLSIETIEGLNTAIIDITEKLNKVEFNIKNSAVRRAKHGEITQGIRKKMINATTVKICFLLVFSLFHIYMITSIFKNVKVVSQISFSQGKKGKNAEETSEFL